MSLLHGRVSRGASKVHGNARCRGTGRPWARGAAGLTLTAGALLGVVGIASAPTSASTVVQTQNFAYTGALQNWTVPPDTTQLIVTANGASGQNGQAGIAGTHGGTGGDGYQIVSTLAVGGANTIQPGDSLAVYVGGQGGNTQLSMFGGGGGGSGSEQGGNGGQGGGGSAVEDQTATYWTDIADGGGGGAGADGFEGNSGPNGGSGYNNGDAFNSPGGSAGLAPAVCTTPPGSPTSGGTGGNAGTLTASGGGGGGGGGCPGGGGGGAGDTGGFPGGGGGTGAPYGVSIDSNATAPSGNGSVSIQYTQQIPVAPTITSANAITFTVGHHGGFTVTTGAATSPTAALSEIGALPGGVGFVDNGDGTATLSGTPNAGTGGTYAISFVATNTASPPAIQSFTMTVDEPPTITSPLMASFTTAGPGSFTVTTTGFPAAAIHETGALDGLTFTDNGNGTATLAGTPTAGGTFPLTIQAGNGTGPVAVATLEVTVDQSPTITSANATTFTVGQAGTFTVTTGATTSPTAALTETGPLPTGLQFTDDGDGTATIAGTAAATTGGTYSLVLLASNGSGPSASQAFTLTVDEAPTLGAGNADFVLSSPGSFTVEGSGFPAPSLTQAGPLPTGLHFTDNGDGTATIAGTPSSLTQGPVTVVVTGTNAAGTASANVTLVVTTGDSWLATANGSVLALGASPVYGSMQGRALSSPVVTMAATPDGGGYWLAAGDGGIFAFGDAAFDGSMGGQPLNKPIVGMAATADGGGYWLVASDGGIFAFGDAAFHGSMGGQPLNKPIAGMAAAPTGGYWLVALDGGIFTFDASYEGSAGSSALKEPVVGMTATADGGGYSLTTGDGNVLSYGDATLNGPFGAFPLNGPVVAITTP